MWLRSMQLRQWRPSPVGVAVALATVIVSTAASTHLDSFKLRALATYRGHDLVSMSPGLLWRLPLSAFLTHGPLDLVWTVFIALVIISALDRALGTPTALLTLIVGHVMPTAATDLYAQVNQHSWLSCADYGSSCLVISAVAALAVTQRSLVLLAGLLIGAYVDTRMNGPMAMTEHALAAGWGAGIAFAISKASVPVTQDLLPWRSKMAEAFDE